MIHLGDITKINGASIEPVDCISFGSPCQDLSQAGKRAGLSGERSGLFMDAVRIIKEMRDATGLESGLNARPRFAIWENVQGAFSSNDGEDFRAVLEELIHIKDESIAIPRPPQGDGGVWEKSGFVCGDDWSLAWRTFNAQYWGVPQRRKRIALVVDFGGQSAGEILFECGELLGNFEESIETWQGVAKCPANSTGRTNKKAYTLKIRGGAERSSDGRSAGKGALVQTELSGTIGVSQDQTLICNENRGGIKKSMDSTHK